MAYLKKYPFLYDESKGIVPAAFDGSFNSALTIIDSISFLADRIDRLVAEGL